MTSPVRTASAPPELRFKTILPGVWPGAGSSDFRTAMSGIVLPAIRKFAPDFLFISAGFDAHRRDPLANLQFETDDFRWATEQLCELAENVCQGRVVSTLEGGYDLDSLGESVAAHVQVLMSYSQASGG